MLIRARWVFPISSPPIENGAVLVENDSISFVGAQLIAPLHKPILDLGDSTLLPGLVNAHCHLEFSRGHISPQPPLTLRGGGQVSPEGIFTAWVREMARGGAQFIAPGRDESRPYKNAIARLLHTGTTTVADHCSPDVPAFETPFRRIPFWEVLGAQRERAASSLQKARERSASEGGHVTPHSLYAVHTSVLETIYGWVARGKVSAVPKGERQNLSEVTGPALSVHLLESSDEDQLLRANAGPLAGYIRERGGDSDSKIPWLDFLVPGTLLIHGNYVTHEEISLLKNRGVTLVHCPGSHRFFGHRRFPLEEVLENGIPVSLGTDSLASNEDLSMLREMRLFRETYPNVGTDEILRMATIEGARALRMANQVGSLEVGKKADLIAVAGPSSLKDVLKAEEVVFSMIDGKICINPSNNSSPS